MAFYDTTYFSGTQFWTGRPGLLRFMGSQRATERLIRSDLMDFPGGSDGKASAYSVEDLGSISGLGRSSGEGNGNSLQYSCLENPMDRGAW